MWGNMTIQATAPNLNSVLMEQASFLPINHIESNDIVPVQVFTADDDQNIGFYEAMANREAVSWKSMSKNFAMNFNVAPQALRLADALERIDADKIQDDVAFLSSDFLKGCETPSHGLMMAADYIRHRLARLGFASVAEGDDYLQGYDFRRFVFDPDETSIVLGDSNRLNHATDYVYTSLKSKNSFNASGKVIVLNRENFSSLSEADVRDNWLLCADSEFDSIERRKIALKLSAQGIIVSQAETELNTREFEYSTAISEKGQSDYLLEQDVEEILLAPNVDARTLMTPECVLHVKRQGIEKIYLSCANNVSALWHGQDQVLQKNVVVLMAHYDHKGTTADDEIYPESDSNASGSAALMAVAEAITKLKPRNSILVLWTSGHNKGLIGAESWLQDQKLPEDYKVVACINLDGIGRNDAREIMVTPTNRHYAANPLTDAIEAEFHKEGFEQLNGIDERFAKSDHFPLTKLKIPVLMISSGRHEDEQALNGEIEHFDAGKIARVSRLLLRVIDRIQ